MTLHTDSFTGLKDVCSPESPWKESVCETCGARGCDVITFATGQQFVGDFSRVAGGHDDGVRQQVV